MSGSFASPLAPGKGKDTLPPPEWGPVVARTTRPLLPQGNTPQRVGVAREAALRRAVREAPTPEERLRAERLLARRLAAMDRGLAEAVSLSLRIVEVEEDDDLCLEVATWLTQLGRFGEASNMLSRVRSQRMQHLARAAVLAARGGDRARAVALAEEAEREGLSTAHVARLVAKLSPAPTRMFLDTWIQNLPRAQRDRAEWATRLWWSAPERRSLCFERCHDALVRGDSHAAVRWGLLLCDDALLVPAFDTALLSVGLLELVAARLELRASLTTGRERAEWLLEAVRLYRGPLSDEARARDAALSAWSAEPGLQAAVATLGGVSAELLSRAGALPSEEERADCLRQELSVPRVLRFCPNAPDEALLLFEARPEDRFAASAALLLGTRAGDAALVARACKGLSGTSGEPLAATLLLLAAEKYFDVGDLPAARLVAEHASVLSPEDPAALMVFSLLASKMGARDALAYDLMHRAVTQVLAVPEVVVSVCEGLVEHGDAHKAEPLLRRLFTEGPCESELYVRALCVAVGGGLWGVLSEIVLHAISEPVPMDRLLPAVEEALVALAPHEPAEAARLSRRLLDSQGVSGATLLRAIFLGKFEDESLLVSALLRSLSAGDPFEQAHREALARLSDEALVETLPWSALSVPERVLALSEEQVEADDLLRLVRAKASILTARGEREDAFGVLWRLGELGWDLAGDPLLALSTFAEASELGTSVPRPLEQTLLSRVPPAEAVRLLLLAAEQTENEDRGARFLTDASKLLLSMGELGRAFEEAARAVGASVRVPEAIVVAEAASEDRLADLSLVYEHLAERAYGRFGRRAAHYRAARFFEKKGHLAACADHAARAFLAVPSEGTSLLFLLKSARRAGGLGIAMDALEEIAREAPNSGAQSAWLLRVADLLDEEGGDPARHVDVLVRAILSQPHATAVSRLRNALATGLERLPDERELWMRRVRKLAETVSKRVEGPDGARLLLGFAELVLSVFDDPTWGIECLRRAQQTDADVDEYENLSRFAGRIAEDPDAAMWVSDTLNQASAPFSNVGSALLSLAAEVANALRLYPLAVQGWVLAAKKAMDGAASIVRAEATAMLSTSEGGEGSALLQLDQDERVAAVRAHADGLLEAGRAEEAATWYARLLSFASREEKPEVEHELVRAYMRAGRALELEAYLESRASEQGEEPLERARLFSMLADLREERGDLRGAARVLAEAARLDAPSLERWSALERVAELAGDTELVILALLEIVAKIGALGESSVLARLARAQELHGDHEAAMHTWQRVHALEPTHEEAERHYVNALILQGAYDELAAFWRRRIARLEQGGDPATFAARLTLAKILGEKLELAEDALLELQKLPPSVLAATEASTYEATLLERLGRHAAAAEVWMRVAERGEERMSALLRAARAFAHSGRREGAEEVLGEILRHDPRHVEALTLSLSYAREDGDPHALREALLRVGHAPSLPTAERAAALLEAAALRETEGMIKEALDIAVLAEMVAPDSASARLSRCRLAYRAFGLPDKAVAERLLRDLSDIGGALSGAEAALRAFLLAETMDLVHDRTVALSELRASEREHGSHPLLSLGIAERLSGFKQEARALEHFRAALGGNLFGLRSKAVILRHAVEAAIRAGVPEEADALCALAERDPSLFEVATRARRDVAEHRESLAPKPRVPDLVIPARESPKLPFGMSVSPGPLEAAPKTERGYGRPAAPTFAPSEVSVVRTETSAPDAQARRAYAVSAPVSVAELEKAVARAEEPAERAIARLALARVWLRRGDPQRAIPLLEQSLSDGVVEAGDEWLLAGGGAVGTRDVLRIRKRQCDMVPGDPFRLEQLRLAAQEDGALLLARAVEHVQCAFDAGAKPISPPPLSCQREQPGLLGLLTRPSQTPLFEALALIWESAGRTFAKDLASYGVTPEKRAFPGNDTPVARVFSEAIRLLDLANVSVYVPRTIGLLSFHVALVVPPAILLSGELREDTAHVRATFGRAMTFAMHRHILLRALTQDEAKAFHKALLAGFGPPDLLRAGEPMAQKVQETLWRVLPTGVQRRLRELLSGATYVKHEELEKRVDQSARRVALFLSGDFGEAARSLLAESRINPELLRKPSDLRGLASQLPDLADLLRLATSAEFAEARWRMPPASGGGSGAPRSRSFA